MSNVFDGPAPLDLLYLKTKKHKSPWMIPFCEVLDGKVVRDETKEGNVSISLETSDEKFTLKKYTKEQFIAMLESELKPLSIEDFAVLPEGEVSCQDVTLFLEKYN